MEIITLNSFLKQIYITFMIRRLLYDIEATQPNSTGKRHGGGIYGEIVLARIIERKLPVAVFFNSMNWFNPTMVELLKNNRIPLFDVNNQSLSDIINYYNPDVLYTPLLGKRTGNISNCKVIATQHGLRRYELPIDLMMLKYRKHFTLYKIIRCILLTFFPFLRSKHIDRLKQRSELLNDNIDFVTVSNHSAYSINTYFPEIQFDTKKVYYSPSTIKERKFEKKYINKYFLLVSANRWEKNNLRAIMALDRLYSQHKIDDFCVMITGATSFKEFKYTIQNPDRFHFLGYIDDGELMQLYHDAYCLVYPSLNEGFGYPPLEAMSQGVPVIASSFASIQEVCQDAVIYTNPFSVEEIMNRILMVTTEDIWKFYSEKGKQRYQIVKKRQDEDLDRLIDYIYGIKEQKPTN